MSYDYGLDQFVRMARVIDPNSEREADDVYDHAKGHRLPVGYVVKAVVRCNQLDNIRMVACDWKVTIESRHEDVEQKAKRAIAIHLRHGHPYLGSLGANRIIAQTQINLRDFGR